MGCLLSKTNNNLVDYNPDTIKTKLIESEPSTTVSPSKPIWIKRNKKNKEYLAC